MFWFFVQLFPATFAGIFSSDPELVSFTAGALRIYCGAMFLFGIQLACQMTFVAIGYAVCSIIVAVVRKFVLLLPLIFIVPMFISNKTMGVSHGGADRRCDRSDIHGDFVLNPVQGKHSESWRKRDKNYI